MAVAFCPGSDRAQERTTWRKTILCIKCDVGFIGWVDDALLLIYREKHDTYACKVGLGETPIFRKIADDWVINDRILGYWGWEDTVVSRLSLPALLPLEQISEETAHAQSVLPTKSW
jgi:hypothetical protein